MIICPDIRRGSQAHCDLVTPALLTALPLGMAHSEVTAHADGVFLGALWAAEVLHALGQGLQGGVHLHVAVAHHVGVVCAVVAMAAVGIGGLLLKRLADEVESTAGRSRGAGRPGKTGSTLSRDTENMIYHCYYFSQCACMCTVLCSCVWVCGYICVVFSSYKLVLFINACVEQNKS